MKKRERNTYYYDIREQNRDELRFAEQVAMERLMRGNI